MSKPDDDFYVLSIRFAEEPEWDEWVSVIGTRETVSQQFDLDNLHRALFFEKVQKRGVGLYRLPKPKPITSALKPEGYGNARTS